MYNFFLSWKGNWKRKYAKNISHCGKRVVSENLFETYKWQTSIIFKSYNSVYALMFANSNPDEQFTMYKITRWKNNQRQKNYCVYKISVYINISLQTTSLFILLGAYNTSKLRFPIIFRSKWWWVRIMHQFVYILYTAKT